MGDRFQLGQGTCCRCPHQSTLQITGVSRCPLYEPMILSPLPGTPSKSTEGDKGHCTNDGDGKQLETIAHGKTATLIYCMPPHHRPLYYVQTCSSPHVAPLKSTWGQSTITHFTPAASQCVHIQLMQITFHYYACHKDNDMLTKQKHIISGKFKFLV